MLAPKESRISKRPLIVPSAKSFWSLVMAVLRQTGCHRKKNAEKTFGAGRPIWTYKFGKVCSLVFTGVELSSPFEPTNLDGFAVEPTNSDRFVVGFYPGFRVAVHWGKKRKAGQPTKPGALCLCLVLVEEDEHGKAFLPSVLLGQSSRAWVVLRKESSGLFRRVADLILSGSDRIARVQWE